VVSTSKPEYWRNLIAEQAGGGQKVRPFCRERGITEPSFYYWRKRLRQGESVQFALLETRPACAKNVFVSLERDAVPEMEEGPPMSACRSRFQTAVSCFGRKRLGGERYG